jgi:hypothetical protein
MESFKEKPKGKVGQREALSRSAANDPRQRYGRKNRDAVGSEWRFSSEAAIGRKSLEPKSSVASEEKTIKPHKIPQKPQARTLRVAPQSVWTFQ